MSSSEMEGKGLSKFYQTYGRRMHHHIVEQRIKKHQDRHNLINGYSKNRKMHKRSETYNGACFPGTK